MSTHHNRINSLPAVLIDRIAAGEVIEAPFSVIKELVENSLDAGAKNITIETIAGGIKSIVIEDDGVGIHPDDLKLALERHATSKIRDLDDLDALLSFGFRGEALASIAAVSHLVLQSKDNQSESGARIVSRGGSTSDFELIACKRGTTIRVDELFFATPARRKYLKSERSENLKNLQIIQKIALAHPQVRIKLIRDNKERLDLFPAKDLLERITAIYNPRLTENLLSVAYEMDGIKLGGYISNENYYRANRDGQHLYVNSRPVEIKNFSWFVKKAYGDLLAPNAYPYYFIFLQVDPQKVDMNVHPQKKEVRLVDEKILYNLVMNSLKNKLNPDTPLEYNFKNPHINSDILSHSVQTIETALFQKPLGHAQSWVIEKSPEANSLLAPGSQSNASPLATSEESISYVDSKSASVNESFVPLRHFGTVFGTYIIAEAEDGLYIIDQHTAHERVNYEKKRRELELQKNSTQILLTPLVLDCSIEEKQDILGSIDDLKECGFVVEDFGSARIIIREVPTYIDPGSENDLFMHLLKRIADGEKSIRLYDEYAAMKACKASIRKNDYVAGGVVSSILLELAECENPSRCPHGRPTMIKMTRTQLDKMFHRI